MSQRKVGPPPRRRTSRMDQALFGPPSEPAPEARPETVTLFIYDRRAFDPTAGGWLNPNQARPASCRGRLLRSPNGRFGFVPDDKGGLVRGDLVEVEAGQLAVLDYVHGTVDGTMRRAPVEALVHLRAVGAFTWVPVDATTWQPVREGGR